jgi:uncharacterized protein
MRKLICRLLRNNWVLNCLVLAAVVVLLLPFFLDLLNAMGLTGVQTEYTGDRVVIRDDAKLLSDEEEELLVKYMDPVAELCATAFVTTANTNGMSNARYAEQLYDHLFPKEEGILFLIDLDNRTLRLQKSNGNGLLTTAMCDSIMDNVYRYAAAGNYFICARETFIQTAAVMNGKSVHQPMKHMSNALIALCLGLMAAFLAACKENNVNRPLEVYQLNRGSKRTIKLSNSKFSVETDRNFAEIGFRVIAGFFSAFGDDDSGGGWSGDSSGGSWSSGSSGGGRSSGGGSSGGSRSSGGSSSGGSRSSGGSHRF